MDQELKTIEQIRAAVINASLHFGPKLLVAILLIIFGILIGKWLGRITDRGLKHFHLEPPARSLLVRIASALVVGLFAIMALQNLGVELLPLIAGLGVAGAGVALAMQGVLGNLVAGLTIIFTKPFRVGEYVSIAGEEGQVESITLSSTVLSHPDLSHVVIPNRKIVGEILHNYGSMRQLEIVISVSSNANLSEAIAAIETVIRDNPRCLREPKAATAISGFANGTICITARPWVDIADYAAAGGELRKAIVETFRAKNIVAPPPRMDVRVIDAPSPSLQ